MVICLAQTDDRARGSRQFKVQKLGEEQPDNATGTSTASRSAPVNATA